MKKQLCGKERGAPGAGAGTPASGDAMVGQVCAGVRLGMGFNFAFVSYHPNLFGLATSSVEFPQMESVLPVTVSGEGPSILVPAHELLPPFSPRGHVRVAGWATGSGTWSIHHSLLLGHLIYIRNRRKTSTQVWVSSTGLWA